MPKRLELKSILIIGAGPIVIGQACEFDYAGTQACKALAEEGCRIILLNSNPATIMTDPEMAAATYIEPITIDVLERIIAIEKPDAILPTLGGQTALNCAIKLAKKGILKKYNVELIGASLNAIEIAEDRALFRKAMQEIGLDVPHSITINNASQIETVLSELSLPLIIRPSFALGGSGAGIAHTREEFFSICQHAFNVYEHQEITIDEALIGWKEYELEVVRDKNDNCIIVCGVENLDPLGIHTGDSIAVAPIQTLSDKEYQHMRQAAFAVLRKVGVETGGSNVQFAVQPQTGRMVVIEMNPRVSRSSALVSKASGFPIAKVAAKLALGFTLDELKNDITGDQLPASFEPSLDYVVVKIPKFDLQKFSDCNFERGPQMRSVGEVMAIGRTFIEALQKAARSLEMGEDTFANMYSFADAKELKAIIAQQTPLQLWAIAEAIRKDIDIDEINSITHIDPWFLTQIEYFIKTEKEIAQLSIKNLDAKKIFYYKQLGFSDAALARLLNCSKNEFTKLRSELNIQPVYKRIDSCAGEFPATTAYLYSTYEKENESFLSDKKKIIIIGSGANRIGQGIEFDYCCVQAAQAIQALGFETIMLNCNPETVSTDYDIVDKLYCTPLSFEDIYEIIHFEKPHAVLIQYGGQTPLKLAEQLAAANVKLIGLTTDIIHTTEDRKSFQNFLQNLQLKQPKNTCVTSIQEVEQAIKTLSFPLIIRPSFVLGGHAMVIVHNEDELNLHLTKIFSIQNDSVLIEEFLQNAIEVDVDAIADGNDVFICGLLEHIEPAGIHSGDSACVTPPINLSNELQNKIIAQTKTIGLSLNLKGIFNVQYAVQNQEIFIIEVNPRASRTLPFLCKATGLPLVQAATKCMFGHGITQQFNFLMPEYHHYFVKEAVLPFNKFNKTNPLLGPEMKSTGEVMGIGKTFAEAFAKAQLAANNSLPLKGSIWVIGNNPKNSEHQNLLLTFNKLGFSIHLNDAKPNNCTLIISLIETIESDTQLVNFAKHAIRIAIDNHISYVTTLAAAKVLCEAIQFHKKGQYFMQPIQSIKQKTIKHFLTGEELSSQELQAVIEKAAHLKKQRKAIMQPMPLIGKQLALLFAKQSLRTRFSFTVAMRELGGDVIESLSATRKTEQPKDLVRVLSGYCHAIMLRTHCDNELLQMAQFSKVSIINGLSELHHPCQILADLLTLQEVYGGLNNLTLTYIGDGNNILHSLLLLAPRLGVTIHYCCPLGRQPNQAIVARAHAALCSSNTKIVAFDEPSAAVKGSDAVYTDVWTSMGFEEQAQEDLFTGFQVNEALMQHAKPNAIFMHCLPMERGKEVSETLPDAVNSVIFQQSENRLHVQKALLLHLLKNMPSDP